jgi:hypothetical protein
MLLAIGCDRDPSPSRCRPKSLQFSGDSLAFSYDDKGRITMIAYYDVLSRKNKQDELSYGPDGRLGVVTKKIFPIALGSYTQVIYTLSYENDLPKRLVAEARSSDKLTTQFTHDDQGRLVEASTTGRLNQFLGSTRYEYDDAGNIPKVYYTLDLNRRIQEVLARENLSFDGNEKFYHNIPELKICNEYLYGYLPTKNNCLSATVYYYSYEQRFVTPQSVTFQAAYNEQGMIKSLESIETNVQYYSGDALFERVLYDCH